MWLMDDHWAMRCAVGFVCLKSNLVQREECWRTLAWSIWSEIWQREFDLHENVIGHRWWFPIGLPLSVIQGNWCDMSIHNSCSKDILFNTRVNTSFTLTCDDYIKNECRLLQLILVGHESKVIDLRFYYPFTPIGYGNMASNVVSSRATRCCLDYSAWVRIWELWTNN